MILLWQAPKDIKLAGSGEPAKIREEPELSLDTGIYLDKMQHCGTRRVWRQNVIFSFKFFDGSHLSFNHTTTTFLCLHQSSRINNHCVVFHSAGLLFLQNYQGYLNNT